MAELTNEAKELLTAFNRVSDEVKNIATDALKAAKESRELTDSVRQAADKNLTHQGELAAQLAELQKHVAAQVPGAVTNAAPRTIGQEFVQSEQVASALANIRDGNVGAIALKATFDRSLSNAVTSDPASAGPLKVDQYVPGIIPPGFTALRIRNLLSWGNTTQAAITYFRELARTNAAGIVSELQMLPESAITFERMTTPVVDIGHKLRAPENVLADIPQLLGYIDGMLMRMGLDQKEEAQLLNGSGVGDNMTGLYTAASAFSNPGVTVTAENRMDRLRIAILQAELSGYFADGMVLNPVDWLNIELLKTASEKNYLVGNPFGTLTPTLWGRPVVASTSMAAGNYLVGAFGIAAQGWDRQQTTVEVGRDGNDFSERAVTIRCYKRLALAIRRTDAMVKGSFGSVD